MQELVTAFHLAGGLLVLAGVWLTTRVEAEGR
jgi:drug/metabolite transporter (DMT)-like permease